MRFAMNPDMVYQYPIWAVVCCLWALPCSALC